MRHRAAVSTLLPAPEAVPPLILVGLDAKEPFQAAPAVYLQDQEDLLTYGLKVLNALAPGKVLVFTAAGEQTVVRRAGQWLTHIVSGNYPCDDPGTVLYHIKSDVSQNRAWFVAGQDLLSLAYLLREGRYPTRRVVAVGGSAAPERRHYATRLGAPIAQLVDIERLDGTERFVVGGLCRGYASGAKGFIGPYETSLNVVPEGGVAEFLALFNPGIGRHSYSRTFLSKLNPKNLVYNCNIHGDLRACIACMHCADVCPVDLLPQMIYKAILAEEVEEYLEQGLLDCVECGLCSYVCPSKIELSQTFVATKAAYAKEQAGKSD
jgi:Na+-transporting NADH:ubiquinone oxidoreductase subunit A